ncbi:zinc ribbon domain-containing protein [Candidatus Bathyarchaeota archaeon]|nr:MAG: zinc ribbon domain-containing protein [Candidatus Bathyarchaeota archaeon]
MSTSNTCPKCGYANLPNARFCANCATQLTVSPPSYQVPQQPPSIPPAQWYGSPPRILESRGDRKEDRHRQDQNRAPACDRGNTSRAHTLRHVHRIDTSYNRGHNSHYWARPLRQQPFQLCHIFCGNLLYRIRNRFRCRVLVRLFFWFRCAKWW